MDEVRIEKSNLEKIKEIMCDDYCYFRAINIDQEVLDIHCEECPLDKIGREKDEGQGRIRHPMR